MAKVPDLALVRLLLTREDAFLPLEVCSDPTLATSFIHHRFRSLALATEQSLLLCVYILANLPFPFPSLAPARRVLEPTSSFAFSLSTNRGRCNIALLEHPGLPAILVACLHCLHLTSQCRQTFLRSRAAFLQPSES